ncbi:MAG TPA: RNA polymerase factor sigma-54 [Burkholderiaceae bacterium]|nr:RNA polymerase factor sigma-54 [Burkholderiaceae bacterium]
MNNLAATAFKLEARQNQTQTLTPRLQHAVRMLRLSSLEYLQELRGMSGTNPFLEVDESEPGAESASESPLAITTASIAGNALDAGSDLGPDGDPATGPDAALEAGWDIPPDLPVWQHPSAHDRSRASDGLGALEAMPATVELRAHLHGQANVLALSERDRALVYVVIESLDDDGYLRQSLDEVAALLPLAPPPDATELATALKLVQAFDPAGVGARDIAECLLLQLRHRSGLSGGVADGGVADAGECELAQRIVAEQLTRLAQHDVVAIARALGRSPLEVETACAAIRHLDPHPGWRFGKSTALHINPDVIVRRVRGRWTVRLNAALVPKVQLNRTYAELFRQHRDARHGELAAHLQEARWAVRNVEQRFSTILAVAQAIVAHQSRFLEFGPFAMKPLGLRAVADELGLHESTVCRVTNNKFMATPVGVFELKYFFSRAMPTASGGASTGTAIRGVIGELLASEDPAHPMSDVEIAQRLARQGLRIARRTVTKYRQMLKVPAVEYRRRCSPQTTHLPPR